MPLQAINTGTIVVVTMRMDFRFIFSDFFFFFLLFILNFLQFSCLRFVVRQHNDDNYSCICQEGWYGPLCAQPTNPCDSFNNKCSEDSTCVPLVNGYECDCPVGRTGKNCDEGKCNYERIYEYMLVYLYVHIHMDICIWSKYNITTTKNNNYCYVVALYCGTMINVMPQ